MNRRFTIILALSVLVTAAACSLVAVMAGPSAEQPPVTDTENSRPRETVASLPAPVDGIVLAKKFTMSTPFTHWWRKERPQVVSGYLMVLRVNPILVKPRQTAEPVLYVGNQTAERLNVGGNDGNIVVIVPGNFELNEARFWFGSRALPEQIDAAEILRQKAMAEHAGIGLLDPVNLNQAIDAGGAPMVVADRAKLLEVAAALINEHSPTESDVANGLLPVSGSSGN